jgi:acyl homoserine lactone synthase
MLHDTFPVLLDGQAAPASNSIWESRRFGLDLRGIHTSTAGGIAKATYELLAGMIEIGLSRHLTSVVTVTDLRIERIFSRADWPLRQLGPPRPIGRTIAVAGCLDVSIRSLDRVLQWGKLDSPEIWAVKVWSQRPAA